MYSFTGRVFPPMRRPLHLILHHLAVHLNVSTGGNLPPQLSDAGCERLYLLRIIGRGSFTLPAIERPALRRKSAIFSLQIFFVSQQFVKRCDLPFPQKIALPPILDFVFAESCAYIFVLPSICTEVTVCLMVIVPRSKSMASHFSPTTSPLRSP
jgi:hypothetical protein